MAKTKKTKCEDTVDAVLKKDSIVSMCSSLLDETPQPRFGLMIVVGEDGGYSLDCAGVLSHLEWLGLSELISKYLHIETEAMMRRDLQGGEEDASQSP